MRGLAIAVWFLAALFSHQARAETNPYTLYALNCMGCHQARGEGHGSIPQLRDFVGNYLHVPGGREFLVQVPGVAQAPLSDAEIAAVLNWMLIELSPEQLPDDFQPYSGTEVAGYRGGRLIDVIPVRARLIEEMRLRNIIE
ncbi:MAG: c-type cytochrome [Dongiaceae bacterium]